MFNAAHARNIARCVVAVGSSNPHSIRTATPSLWLQATQLTLSPLVGCIKYIQMVWRSVRNYFESAVSCFKPQVRAVRVLHRGGGKHCKTERKNYLKGDATRSDTANLSELIRCDATWRSQRRRRRQRGRVFVRAHHCAPYTKGG